MTTKNLKRILPIILLAFALLWAFTPDTTSLVEEVSRQKLDRLLAENALINAELNPKPFGDIFTISGTYSKGPASPKNEFTITTHVDQAHLDKILANPHARIVVPKISTRPNLVDIIPTVVVAAMIFGLLLYQVRLSKGKGTHRIRQRPTVRFADVAGVEEAKYEVQEVIDFLRDPSKYHRLGGNLPKGILLIGPPGTGKTMLAKAIAGEANANFFSASGSDFNEIYVGVGAKRIRELFEQARKHRPSIIFIDEIDCLGKNRKFDQNGESQQTNNALLTAMDGFDTSEGVIVVAATNRPEDLDEALTRPGRFDRKVNVPLPDSKGRRAILQSHSKKTPIRSQEWALDRIAQTTPGMSGAELANVLNEAAILSAQKCQTEITLAELEEARDRVRFGKERKSMTLKADERRIVAYHEAGHAIIALSKPLLPPLHKVSIIPRGSSLGSTVSMPKEDQNLHGKKFLLQQLVVLMGGRAAETIFIGDMTNGANGDLDSAKNIARKMIHDWGMGEKLYYQPEKADAEKEINALLTEAGKEAREIILAHRVETEKVAEALLVEETLSRAQILELMGIAAEPKFDEGEPKQLAHV